MDELAQRLEKSEAGRKKLRQAIAILQEKLDGMEKVLKINEKLRQECEQEKKRADSEKQKAEEEKRLKLALEKDSTALKDQLAKVLQRVGAVENKQKVDKKEFERLRNEVKLCVEGMHVASQAVNAVQNSCQALEATLLEKVNAAFEEARAATQAVNDVKDSLQSIELEKQVSSLKNDTALQLAGRASQKLVNEISRLFSKERQSHCKIEHRLSMLKSAFDLGRRPHSPTNAVNIAGVESLAFMKKKKEKTSKKRKSRGEEEAVIRRVRKHNEASDMAARNSEEIRMDSVDKDESLSSPHVTEQLRISEETGSFRSYNTASNDLNEDVTVNYRVSSAVNARMVSPNKVTVIKPKVDSNVLRATIATRGCQRITLAQNKCSSEVPSEDLSSGIHARRLVDGEEHQQAGISACGGTSDALSDVIHSQDNNDATDSDFDSSEEWWLSDERILLTPSLPEIASPLHQSSDPPREPSHCGERFESVTGSPISCNIMKDAPAYCEAANSQGDLDCACGTLDACSVQFDAEAVRTVPYANDVRMACLSLEKEQRLTCRDPLAADASFETSTELGVEALAQRVQWNSDISVNLAETAVVTETVHDEFVSHENHPSVDPPTRDNHIHVLSRDICSAFISRPGDENSVRLGNPEVTQLDDCMLEAVNDTPLAELEDFLKVLPPLPAVSPRKFCCSSDPSPNVPQKFVDRNCSYEQICTSNKSLTDGVRNVLLNDFEKGFGDEVGKFTSDSTNAEHAIGKGCIEGTDVEQAADPILEQMPAQGEVRKSNLTKKRDGMETTDTVIIQESQPSTFQSSGECKTSSLPVVFLVQAFDVQDTEAKVNLMAACISISKLENYLVHVNTDEGEALQEKMELQNIMGLPMVYVSCGIISRVVVKARSRNGGTDVIATAEPIHTLLQAYVAFIKRMFIEKANMVLNNIFAQLSRFLTQGEAMLVTVHGSMSPFDNALDVARVIHENNQCTYDFFEANLEDIYAGGKVLATLCQVLTCVTHLQNIVYEVLGWCDKGIMWLLTVFSSFSSICGHTAFMAEADDLLGYAICAIIIELVGSVEQEAGNEVGKKVNEATPNLPHSDQKNLSSWAFLKQALKTSDECSINQVVVAALDALEHLLSSTTDLIHPDISCKDCHASNYGQKEESQCLIHKVPSLCKIMPVSLGNLRDSSLESLGTQKWPRKYVEVVRALDLIMQFMGWDWTYNHLIGGFLWKMLAPGSSQIRVSGVSYIFTILIRIAARHGGTDLPGLVELKECIFNLLRHSSTLTGKAEAILLFELQQSSQCVY